MGWWHAVSEDSEFLYGPHDTREAAVAAGRVEYGGEAFAVCEGERFKNRHDIFDDDYLADRFNDANEDYAGEENASEKWEQPQINELVRELEQVFSAWLDRHGYRDAYSIDVRSYETIPAATPA